MTLGAVGRDHDLLLDPGRRAAVGGGAVGLEREEHALLDLDRVVERVQAADDRSLVQADADAVSELEPERVHLVLEAELRRLGPHGRDLIGADPGLHEVDRGVHPLARAGERVALRLRGAADDERAVVAGPVAVVHVDDVEVRLVARADQPVREDVRVRAAALARDRVDRLDELGAHLEQPRVGERDDVALADPGLEELEDVVVDAVHHGAGLRQERDLVRALDLAGEHHRLLTVADVEAGPLQLQEDRGLGDVDAERHVADAVLPQDRADLLGRAALQPDDRRDGALQTGVAADRVGLVVPLGELEPVRLGGRAEVPDARRSRPRDQGVPLALVERPVADVRAGRVPDVAGLEQQERSEVRGLQLRANAGEPVLAEAVEVDAVLPVHPGEAGGRCRRDRELLSHAVLRSVVPAPVAAPGR